MDQIVGRRSHQRTRDLNRNFQRLLCVKRTILTYASPQRFPFDQFHRVIAVSAIWGSTKLENGSYIWVPKGSRGSGLA